MGVYPMYTPNGLINYRIEFEAGAKCSEHYRFKSNGFYVEKGVMLIRVWQEDQKLLDETILKAGDYTGTTREVPPIRRHRRRYSFRILLPGIKPHRYSKKNKR